MKFLNDYIKPADLPSQLRVFPLNGALLLPRADLPLNIFEPRYIALIADALSGDRIIGMIQPHEGDNQAANAHSGQPLLMRTGCAGLITSFAETPDRRVLVTLTGLCRFHVTQELAVETAYRQIKADYSLFGDDLITDKGEEHVNRTALLATFREYLTANDMNADWEEIKTASTETLINTLSLLAPHQPREKQALLEAPDLKSRADVLVALTEIALAKYVTGKRHSLQ